MIKKVILAVMFGFLTLVGTTNTHAQSLNELMPMVAQQMNQGLTASDPLTKVEWNPTTSSLVLFINEGLLAKTGMDATTLSKPETKEFIISAMCENENDRAEMKQTLQAMEQIGVHFVIRIPVGGKYTDITISSADFN